MRRFFFHFYEDEDGLQALVVVLLLALAALVAVPIISYGIMFINWGEIMVANAISS